MKLTEILNLDNLNKRLADRYILMQKHPSLPLRIFNYSPSAMFDDVWDHEVCICRGLIVDDEDNVIARPFYKFFNLNDTRHPETWEANLPKIAPMVTEKMDGSLGICWQYRGESGIATRGSFTSEQAQWATSHLHTKYPHLMKMISDDETLLVEIIYPENVIVVNYDFADIVALALVNNLDGSEWPLTYLERRAEHGWPRVVKRFDKDLATVVSENVKNAEGYVLSWHFKDTHPARVKVKFPDYMRLHKLITGVSPKSLCKMLSEGLDPANDIGTELPQPFIDWVRDWTTKFLREYDRIYKGAHDVYRHFLEVHKVPPEKAGDYRYLQFSARKLPKSS